MRLLVRSWRECEREAQRNRVVVENILGKNTRARAADVYEEIFVPRFIRGNPPEAWKIIRPLEDREAPFEILRPLYYWITARSDALLFDFVVDEILPRSRGPDLSVRVGEAENWIKKRLSQQGRSWSRSVTVRVAQGLLAALRDFGILEGAVRKRIAPTYLPVESFAYLAFCLYDLGSSGAKLVRHRDWKLFLMDPPVVEGLFLDAHRNRLLHYEAAGKIYRIEFFAQNLEEMTDVVAGKRN